MHAHLEPLLETEALEFSGWSRFGTIKGLGLISPALAGMDVVGGEKLGYVSGAATKQYKIPVNIYGHK